MLKSFRIFSLPLRNLCYKSDISLSSLYPKSKADLFTPTIPATNPNKFNGFIPLEQLEVTYSTSTGPGGQNVNKVTTKCDLRFKISSANWLSEETKSKLLQEHKNRITKDGYLIIKSDLTRYRHMNLADALEKLRNVIRTLEVEQKLPSEESIEKHKRRQEKLSAQRVQMKRQRSMTKAQRQEPV